MASKVPVVATRVGGIPKIIEHHKTGLLVDPEDVQGLADRINELMKNESLRQNLIQTAFTFVNENYSYQSMCDHYRTVYQNVMSYARTVSGPAAPVAG
jgi:glycosyltransferase involved in cell wall biosynthesis